MASLRLCRTFHALAHAPVFTAASPDDAAPAVLARDPFSVTGREARQGFRMADLAKLRFQAATDALRAVPGLLRLRTVAAAGGWIDRDTPFERCPANALAGQQHAA
jgi:hypothetical protein